MSEPVKQRSFLEFLIQRYLLPGIAIAYCLAAFFPEFGIWLRSYSLVDSATTGLNQVTAVNLLLAALLFNTGLSVPLSELSRLTRHPKLIMLGLSVRVTSGCLIIAFAMLGGLLFQGPDWDMILLGLILIAVMPVANSSAGWTHHSEANVGLSMWLILCSVLMSPILVPGLLQFASLFADASCVENYRLLAGGYAGSFVMTWVILPAVAGIIFRALFIRHRYPQWKLAIKLVNSICLLLLNYTNGAVSLPEVLRDGVGMTFILTAFTSILLCTLLFIAAWLVGKMCLLEDREQLAVMYSTAMSNTGVALVLATALLPTAYMMHLVIILYTLMQHIVAGIVDQCYEIEEQDFTLQSLPQSPSSPN